MSKREKGPKGIPLNDPRVKALRLKKVEEFCELLKECECNPSYLLTKSNFKTTQPSCLKSNFKTAQPLISNQNRKEKHNG